MDHGEIEELRLSVAELTRRVYQLEKAAGVAAPASVWPRSAQAPQPLAPPRNPAAVPPQMHAPMKPAAKPADSRGMEAIIGGQWLNRIGITALLIGTAYFLKLAIDNNWIGPSGRVTIGLLSGIALIIWASRLFTRGMRYFSFSLTALGVGIMYLSLYAAFQLYNLVPGGVAFAAMIAVTASAATIALRQNAEILGAVTLAGGFATPVLLSTHQNHEVALFTYVLLLDVFALALVAMRPWGKLLFAALVGTVVLYIGWFSEYYTDPQLATTVIFSTLFFLLFAGAVWLRRFSGLEYDRNSLDANFIAGVLIINPAVFFLQLSAMLYDYHLDALAWAAVVLGAFYIFLSRQVSKERGESVSSTLADKWLHLAVGLSFITIAVPLKLNGHWITIGWLVESALLLFVGWRAQIWLVRFGAVIALALGIFRLLFIDYFATEHVIFNARFGTYCIALAIMLGIAIAAHRFYGLEHPAFVIASIVFNVLALIALTLEVRDFYAHLFSAPGGALVNNWRDISTQRDFTYSALYMLYGAALMGFGFLKRMALLRWQALVLIGATIAKVFIYDLSELSGPLRVLSFIALGVLLMALSFVYQKDWLKLSEKNA
jgi:uncharacterized membrane protein